MVKRRGSLDGLILLELGISQILGSLSLITLLVFFIMTSHYFETDMRRWSHVHSFKVLAQMFDDALTMPVGKTHCRKKSRQPFIEIRHTSSNSRKMGLELNEIILYSCRWINRAWKWSRAIYMIREHLRHFYVYEKINDQPAEPWILGIKHWTLKLLPYKDGETKKFLLAIRLDWEERGWRNQIKTLILSWPRSEK